VKIAASVTTASAAWILSAALGAAIAYHARTAPTAQGANISASEKTPRTCGNSVYWIAGFDLNVERQHRAADRQEIKS
jgi:hypothetical protein